jgi:hypothetical protein
MTVKFESISTQGAQFAVSFTGNPTELAALEKAFYTPKSPFTVSVYKGFSATSLDVSVAYRAVFPPAKPLHERQAEAESFRQGMKALLERVEAGAPGFEYPFLTVTPEVKELPFSQVATTVVIEAVDSPKLTILPHQKAEMVRLALRKIDPHIHANPAVAHSLLMGAHKSDTEVDFENDGQRAVFYTSSPEPDSKKHALEQNARKTAKLVADELHATLLAGHGRWA